MSPPKTVLVSSPTFGRYSERSTALLREYGCEFVELSRDEAADRETLYEHLPGASAWIVGYTEIDAETLDRAPELEIVAKHGTGVDNVDLDAARERGVVVANAPGANANAVAELVILHVLNFSRDLVRSDRAVRERRWDGEIGRELAGRTLGIVGLGEIGQTLVRRTRGFDLEYLAYDVEERPEFQERYDVTLVDELGELLERADFVTVHVPLNEHTRHLVGAEAFEAMRPDACLINAARGGIVDEDALLDAIRRDEIGGAALDVLEEEPPGESGRYDEFLSEERITFSPHVGGYTEEAFREISEVTARNVLSVFEAEEPLHRVA